MSDGSPQVTSLRMRLVEDHIQAENRHDLDAIIATFGMTARYDDEPWQAHYIGRQQVSDFYSELLRALPDLHIAVSERHEGAAAIILETVITGRHLHAWRGLPATGHRVEFPLCAIFTFDRSDRLAGEKIYYDRALVFQQLGIFHEPEHMLGRLNTLIMHPVTIAAMMWIRFRGNKKKRPAQ